MFDQLIHILQFGFIQKAFISGIFVSALCSVLGVFLVLRRLSLIGDGLAHVSFGAIAFGLFLGLAPIYVALPLVVLGSLLILALSEKTHVYGDAIIGIVSSVGIATGVIFASVSHGFNVDLFSYLFGNILAISDVEMYLSIAMSVLILVLISIYYYDMFAVTFNEDHAYITGINVKLMNRLLVVLTAITVVLCVRIVGVMLVSALLILPAMSALQIARGFKSALFYSVIFSVSSIIIGILASFVLNIPTGATIVLVNFVMFLTTYFISR